MVPGVSYRMGNPLHSLELYALVFFVIFVVAFLYPWLRFLQPQSAGARHFQAKRYSEAAEAFQTVLNHRPPPGIEADTRRRLADTLDVLGRSEEAAAERERASAAATKNINDPAGFMAQGDLLTHQGRYDDACPFFDRALALTPSLPGSGRAHIMAKLALAHQQAGRSGESIRWAEASLANGPDKNLRRMMESIAGVGYADQGDLEKAEYHYQRALELAEATGKPVEVSRTLAILGGVYYKRGHFEQALGAARRAWETAAEPSRTALVIEAECLRDMGRFDEARAVIARHRQGPRFDEPRQERKMQALGTLALAYIELFAGQPFAALPCLEEVQEGLKAITKSNTWPPPATGGEEKLVLWCDAAMSTALAGVGHKDEARHLLKSVQNRLPNFGNDRATLLGTYGSLGRAAFALDDFSAAEAFWHLYLDCRPNPVSQPNAFYWLGEIALRLSDIDAAREAFQQAVAPGIDSLYARRAQARLDELGG